MKNLNIHNNIKSEKRKISKNNISASNKRASQKKNSLLPRILKMKIKYKSRNRYSQCTINVNKITKNIFKKNKMNVKSVV